MDNTTKITVAQTIALHEVYSRAPLYAYLSNSKWMTTTVNPVSGEPPITFRYFIEITQMMGDIVMVPWAGMWLGIETDGYTHS